MFFKLGNAGWYCVTKGNIFLHAVLVFSSSDVYLSQNFTSERCFSTVVAGYPLYLRLVAKFLMFSSIVLCEESVLRSLNASPVI